MHRAAPKTSKQRVAKPTRVVKTKKATTKRTIVTKRAVTRQQQQPTTTTQQRQQSFQTMTSKIAPLSFEPQAMSSLSLPTTTAKRAFGGHAAPVIKKEPEYDFKQSEKYGKPKFAPLFETDTPSFQQNFKKLEFDSQESASARPQSQKWTAEELIEQFGIVLVDKPTAHCVGTPDGPHPMEFIQVHNSTPKVPQICKYCGTRFMHKDAFDGSFVPFNQEH